MLNFSRMTLCLTALLGCLMSSFAVSQESIGEIKALTEKIMPQDFPRWSESERLAWLDRALQANPGTAEQYVLRRLQLKIHNHLGKFKEMAAICSKIQSHPEDVDFRVVCLYANEESLGPENFRERLYDVLKIARLQQDSKMVSQILRAIGWSHSQQGNITEAWACLEEALSIVSNFNSPDALDISRDLAINYYVHGNTEYIHKGIGLLTEIKEKAARRSLEGPPEDAIIYRQQSELSAYNIGIAYALHLHDYEKAIPELVASKGYDFLRVHALTFAALSAAEIGRHNEAKDFLREIKGEMPQNPMYTKYLGCYQALTIRHWDAAAKLTPCFQLSGDTPLQVATDIHLRLAKLQGSPDELLALRSFMNLYQDRIEREFKKKSTKGASTSELKRLEAEAKLKDEKLALSNKIEKLLHGLLVVSIVLLGLVLSMIRSRRIIKKQAQNITAQKLDLQHVLDNIDEGIVSFRDAARISPIYSRHAAEILGVQPNRISVVDLLRMMGLQDDAQAETLALFQAVLGEDAIAWDLNAGRWPQAGFIHGKPLQFYWVPIVSKGRITEIILSMRDASATLTLEREAKARSSILAVVRAGALGHNFIADLDEQLEELRQHACKDKAKRGLQLAHTLKGEARGLGFADLQDQLHLFEQGLLQEDFSGSLKLLTLMQGEVQALRDAVTLVKDGETTDDNNPVLPIAQGVLNDARKRLRTFGFEFSSDLHFDWVDFTAQEITALRLVMIHAVANAIDHGYLRPKQSQKPCDPVAHLSLSLATSGDDIHFTVVDGGAGIDWKALEELARQRNWNPSEKSELTDLVFMDRVSTVKASEVSKTSGRGLGMAAVADAVKSLEGTIKFGPGPQNRGAQLDIRWNHRRLLEVKTSAAS